MRTPLTIPDPTALALADQGLGAKWWFETIQRLGGRPLLRVKAGGALQPVG